MLKQLNESEIIKGFFSFSMSILYCHELMGTVNPENNLEHCFCCQRNINNIDLMIELGYDFKQAVSILENWRHEYHTGNVRKRGISFCRIF